MAARRSLELLDFIVHTEVAPRTSFHDSRLWSVSVFEVGVMLNDRSHSGPG